jgi:predicted Zn-dependent protease
MKLSEVKPTDEEIRVILEAGFVLREAGKLDDAEAAFRGVMELFPNSDVPRVALSTIEARRGRFAEAQAICEEAVRLQPNSLYARVHHAEVLLFQRRRAEAEAELHEIIALDPDSPHSRTARALLDVADIICATDEASQVAP